MGNLLETSPNKNNRALNQSVDLGGRAPNDERLSIIENFMKNSIDVSSPKVSKIETLFIGNNSLSP